MLETYARVAAVVEDVDGCVMSVLVPVERRAGLLKGDVWARVSADSGGTRVNMPTEDEGPLASATLEGTVEQVTAALGLLYDALVPQGMEKMKEKFFLSSACGLCVAQVCAGRCGVPLYVAPCGHRARPLPLRASNTPLPTSPLPPLPPQPVLRESSWAPMASLSRPSSRSCTSRWT